MVLEYTKARHTWQDVLFSKEHKNLSRFVPMEVSSGF